MPFYFPNIPYTRPYNTIIVCRCSIFINMIRLKSLLWETACPFPNSASQVRTYLQTVLTNADTTIEIFDALNRARATWSDADYDQALNYGACEIWNIEISTVLAQKGIMSQVYQGTPLESGELPQHYYCKVGDTIIDFVVDQFWGWGLGAHIDDADRVTFSEAEYADILDAYSWRMM